MRNIAERFVITSELLPPRVPIGEVFMSALAASYGAGDHSRPTLLHVAIDDADVQRRRVEVP